MNQPNFINSKDWREFFTSFQTLQQPAQLEYRSPLIASAEFWLFAQNFSRMYEENRRFGNDINIWKVAQVAEDELRNSAILAWLLDHNGSHGQGKLFLAKFLKLLKLNGDPIFQNISLDKPYWTRIESLPLGDKESRIDIEIEGEQFLLFIEVKINAPETNDQLGRYINLAKKKTGNRPWAVVFLTRNGRRPIDESLHDIVIPIGWHQVQKIVRDHTRLQKCGFSSTIFQHLADHFATF